MGDMFAKAIKAMMVTAVLIALPVGWALIEGAMWVFNHVAVTFK